MIKIMPVKSARYHYTLTKLGRIKIWQCQVLVRCWALETYENNHCEYI